MKLIVVENYEEMSRVAADKIKAVVNENPNAILGLATGSTPVGTYKELIEMNKNNEIDFSQIKTVNLDEYIGLGEKDPQSYRYFMNENLFNHINIKKENTFVPNGLAKDIEEEAKNYDMKIDELGGIDIQILGIGSNGHIAFNEPADALTSGTHLTQLTESTIAANSRFFNSIDEVPKTALTMGVGQIMKSKRILLLANGDSKADAVKEIFSGKITSKNPATMLQMHKDVTVIVDKKVGELIKNN
ncbi:glucosamine-6-phosphate deaminase [Clostridium saccharoperbutylacetonicum]|jgi:glucosamine-6-phosphate deaminase|uniref:Glucosamine-6-phosphate deaminase n=1 Tax=Clostridium saccharoperbutylacetonicum N1-4(HMT) TaxID=931276 RepID=M1MQW5_9CLOT|nr:glucosamine-6-phosphate deaminase [Clostridium saccharoperbutylacetonicum]AGF58573.1 glucosamine-6-phosphate deaminase NagB [Clostridium saccharoperbutylacetonicum N1-4(HMT)]AQR97263.1 glucosamine-6-phosphate deaminase 1 [Clostridium saccharoperbutylacetonicum]NRT60649.1 glucosamine-6-phosphate deaminase [Clostridium saccharoperbutylacetonicum]NSB23963.1 glucosamine-6-phosphate deaminase [Clostridium saccharoperbutylacetonicum]NSB33145.1 glucosamine-6-phosphate deaminase [Clostridium saccha